MTRDGTPLIFLHGAGTGPGAWAPQREALGQDRATAAPKLPLDLEAAPAIVEREIDGFGGTPVDLCGLSFGAVVALAVAARSPRRVRRLVLAAGFARLPPAFRALQRLVAVAFRAAPAASLARRLTGGVPEPYREQARHELADLRPVDVARAMRQSAAVDLTAAARSLLLPVLVVCGDRDRSNLRLARELVALFPHAELHVIPGAGHVSNLDNPADFTQCVREFLDKGSDPVCLQGLTPPHQPAPSSSRTPCG